MEKAKKFLRSLSSIKQDEIDEILFKIEHGEIRGLNIKKLKGYKNLFRACVGDIRIVFSQEERSFNVLFIGRRGDFKYKQF